MQHQIDAIGLAPNVLEECFDLIVAGNIAWKQRRFLPELGDEFLNVLL
jgi:hypothetical protein